MSQVKKFLPQQEGGDFSSQQHFFAMVLKDMNAERWSICFEKSPETH